jgi:hypothetical protein
MVSIPDVHGDLQVLPNLPAAAKYSTIFGVVRLAQSANRTTPIPKNTTLTKANRAF